jgi:hypothetical protein
MYEQACAKALSRLGVSVSPFTWNGYFKGLAGRLQDKFPVPGPASLRLNRDLLRVAKQSSPEIFLIWRGTHILPATLRKLKKEVGAVLVSCINDDPWGPRAHDRAPWHHYFYWNLYLKCVAEYDIHFVYRPINVSEVLNQGAKEAYVLMPYYVPELHHNVRITETEKERYGCDVVFAGHYEPDGREKYLQALVGAGLHVRLFGGKYWTRKVLGPLAEYFGAIHPAEGAEYSKVLCAAKMCLCFLSKLNRDTYTRRCFEIPACGRLLLSERTKDLEHMFIEDKEAVFFSNPEELVKKALWLRGHPKDIDRIAQAGMLRVYAGDHSVDDRMKQMISILGKYTR